MKRGMIAALCLMAVLLGACSASDSVPATEPEPVQTEAAAVPTEPAPTEPETVDALTVSEYYGYRAEENATWYSFAISLYPNSCYYSTRDTKDGYVTGIYSTEKEDRIRIDIDGEPCIFRKRPHSLVLESGKLAAYSSEGESVELPVGTAFGLEDRMELRDGIYVLDTSEYTFSFDEVLMDIDLTQMTFTLRCFDGNVVTGTLGFDGFDLVCSHPGGRMLFHINDYEGLVLDSMTRNNLTGSLVSDQLMLCPQTDASLSYQFVYAEGREEEIVADPEVVPLDSYKHLYEEYYSFVSDVIEINDLGNEVRCSLWIHHYLMEDKWTFSTGSSQPIEVKHTENPDGSIIFLQNGKEWSFHWEGENLCFDGGSPLVADNGSTIEKYYRKMDVPDGAAFYKRTEDYIYDALYILPGETLEECYAAIQIDTKNQLLKIQCYDGTVLSGPYTYEGYYLNFPCEIRDYVGMRSTYIMLTPHGHSLGVSDQWMLNIGPGEPGSYENYDLFPVVGVDYEEAPAETETEPA